MKYLKVWTSFKDLLQPLELEEIGSLFLMMLSYAESGEEPTEFVGNESFLFPVARQQIDLAMERAEKLRENGMKGGRPKNQTEPNETKDNQTKPNETKDNQSEPVKKSNVMESNEKKGNEKEGNDNIRPLKRFIPPTADDVQKYCDERGVWLIDPQRFVDYYEARGWMLTKNRKMVDWKAAVRTWEKNERERQHESRMEGLPY